MLLLQLTAVAAATIEPVRVHQSIEPVDIKTRGQSMLALADETDFRVPLCQLTSLVRTVQS